MSTINNLLCQAIDVPLMDVKNISKIILGYIEKKIYCFNYSMSRGRHDYYNFKATILAESPLDCWKEWKRMLKKIKIEKYHRTAIKWRLKKQDFLNNLKQVSNKPYYSERKVQSVYIEEFEDGCILDYNRTRTEKHYYKKIRAENGVKHEFSEFPFYKVGLDFCEEIKALYYRDFIEGVYTVGSVTYQGSFLNTVYI